MSNEALMYIAKHVREWPSERVTHVDVDRDGEIRFGPDAIEWDFYPPEDEIIEGLSDTFSSPGVRGRGYIRAEWEEARASLTKSTA